MLTEAADFKAESDALHALLQDKDDADFERPTLFKDWSVNDVMGHLHIWNHAVNLSVTDEAASTASCRRSGTPAAGIFPTPTNGRVA